MTGLAGLERLSGCYLSYLVGLGKELRVSAPPTIQTLPFSDQMNFQNVPSMIGRSSYSIPYRCPDSRAPHQS